MDFCLFGLNNFEVFQSFYSNYDIICVGRVGRPLKKFKAFSLLLTTLSDTREVESYILQFHGMNSILILLIIFLWISIPGLYIHGFAISVYSAYSVYRSPWSLYQAVCVCCKILIRQFPCCDECEKYVYETWSEWKVLMLWLKVFGDLVMTKNNKGFYILESWNKFCCYREFFCTNSRSLTNFTLSTRMYQKKTH